MSTIVNENSYLATIELSTVRTFQGFVRMIDNAIALPEYFGGSMDALDDCMRDLSWLNSDNITLQFVRPKKIKNNTLYQNILDSITLWQEFWDHASHQKKVVIKWCD